MKTSKKLIKKAICLFLIAILNINTFGAIVSDNDGSAFITKAEFDALKSSFQAQIDEYNTSIDSKIDGAIAAYLAGIKLSTVEIVESSFSKIVNAWDGVKNLSEASVEEHFLKLPITKWIFNGVSLVALGTTATIFTKLKQGNTVDEASKWFAWTFLGLSDGDGFGLFGDSSLIVNEIKLNTFPIVNSSNFKRYQYSYSNTSIWFEGNEYLKVGEDYFSDDSKLGLCGVHDSGSILQKAIQAKRYVEGCTTNILNTKAYFNYGYCDDSKWADMGIVGFGQTGGRVTTQYGSLNISINNGEDCLFISNANPYVNLFDDKKEYCKFYPDTDYDTSRIVSCNTSYLAGNEERVNYHNYLCPPFAFSRVNDTKFNLQNLTVKPLMNLQDDKSKNLKFGDGLPVAFLEKAGDCELYLEIQNNSSQENFSEFEVFISDKPFSQSTELIPVEIYNGKTKIDYVPVNTEVRLEFTIEKEKSQLYLWWQAKDFEYGGMLVSMSDIYCTVDV